MSESSTFGVSWRGWLAALILAVYCGICVVEAMRTNVVPEHLVQVVGIVIGFYFGQKTARKDET